MNHKEKRIETMSAGKVCRVLAVLLLGPMGSLCAGPLAPWKDDLFALPATLSEKDGGAYRVVDYREERDINERDTINERRVKKDWVSLDPRRKQKNGRMKTATGMLRYISVGTTKGASTIVVYLHGQGGSREQGVDDWSFGGNFNRLKNLMFRNGGLYLSPDVADFGQKGTGQIKELILKYLADSPGADLIVACGSAGGRVGYGLARDEQIGPQLDGMLLLGSFPDSGFRSGVAVYIGHGGNDTVSPVASMENFYRSLRSSGSPAQMVRFETGSHGTPIRMTDWRAVINWMKGR